MTSPVDSHHRSSLFFLPRQQRALRTWARRGLEPRASFVRDRGLTIEQHLHRSGRMHRRSRRLSSPLVASLQTGARISTGAQTETMKKSIGLQQTGDSTTSLIINYRHLLILPDVILQFTFEDTSGRDLRSRKHRSLTILDFVVIVGKKERDCT